MATKPGVLSEWPWQRMGNYKVSALVGKGPLVVPFASDLIIRSHFDNVRCFYQFLSPISLIGFNLDSAWALC
jgi:hypothetical protein